MRLLLIPLLFVTLSTLAYVVFGDRLEIPESFDEAVAWIRSYERWAWAVAVGVIMGDFLLPLPSTPALVVLGIVYGPLLGGLIGGAATTTAGLMGYGLTRSLGRRGALFIVGERDLARAQRFYDRWGVSAVVLGRAVGGPLEWLILIAGISGMPFRRVLAALLAGGCTAAFVVAWLGDMAVEQPWLALSLVVMLASGLAWLGRRLLAHAPGSSPGTAPSSAPDAASARPRLSRAGTDFTVLYDGDCPYCRLEVRWLGGRDASGRLGLLDITAPDFDAGRYGATHEQLMARIHGVHPDGRVVEGMEVFREAYRAVGLGWLTAPTGWPVLRWIFDGMYVLFARNRVALGRLFGRDCDDDACTLPRDDA